MAGFFLYTLRKTQVGKKLRFFGKLRYFSKTQVPKMKKGDLDRKFLGENADFWSVFDPFPETQVKISAKLRSILIKLRSENRKTYLNRKSGTCEDS